MLKLVVLTIVIVHKAVLVLGYPSGAPSFACATMDPVGHGPSTANGPAPYNLTVSNTSYMPGDVLQVVLTGTSGAQFKGFLITAKKADGSSADPVGTFSTATNAKITCSSTTANGITHASRSVKSSFTVNWKAPSTSQGDIVFHYTVVRGGAPGTTSNPPDYFKDLTTAAITPVKAPQSGTFTKDPACGVSRGCYSNCKHGVCDWELTWTKADDGYNIALRSVFTGDNKWVAIGFSKRPAMFEASVVACVTHNGKVSAVMSTNPTYANVPLPNPSEGISNQNNSYTNGILTCTFTRAMTSTNPKIFNLTQPWHLITARGNTKSDGRLSKHSDDNNFNTEKKVDLSDVKVDISFSSHDQDTTTDSPSTSMTTSVPSKKFRKDPECGKTKGCYSNCDDDICDLLLAWVHKGDYFEITLKSGYDAHDDHYIALGFSEAARMYDASVVACTVYQGKTDAFISFNKGRSNILLDNPKEGIGNVTGSYVDGVLECTFTRATSSSNNSKIYDLRKPWYLITARGAAGADGVMSSHNGFERYYTSSRVDFSDLSVDISLEEAEYPRIKAHACLMVIAWMLSASMGLAFARFSKKLWPSSTWCGVKIWFAVHRSCMVLTFLMGITAFVLIFVEVGGYSEITGETYKKAHPILGIIVTSLLVINPFMALLRCAPDHPKRPIFNYAHWFVGSTAHILAGVTITLGLYLPKAQVDKDLGLLVMMIYLAWHLFFFLVMSVLDFMSTSQKCASYDLNNSTSTDALVQNSSLQKNSDEPPKSAAKKVMTLFHGTVLTALTLFLLYLIIEGDV